MTFLTVAECDIHLRKTYPAQQDLPGGYVKVDQLHKWARKYGKEANPVNPVPEVPDFPWMPIGDLLIWRYGMWHWWLPHLVTFSRRGRISVKGEDEFAVRIGSPLYEALVDAPDFLIPGLDSKDLAKLAKEEF